MGLFGKKKKETEEEIQGVGLVESAGTNNGNLQDLLNEFREMRAGIRAEQHNEEHEEIEEDFHDGEEYEVSEEESDSIESFLSGNDEIVEEEIIEEDFDDEFIEEDEVDEEEVLEEEVLDEEDFELEDESDIEDSLIEEEEIESEEDIVAPVDVDVTFNEVQLDQEDEPEEEFVDEVEEESIEEDFDGVVEEIDEPNEELIDEPQQEAESVTSEELDKKFDDFEKRLLDKIMQQFAMMQPAQVKEEPVVVVKKESVQVDDDELNISTVDGKLVINDYKFMGEVVMFTPIDSLRKATWEEVVRRKGHCTYHLTTSGNGGWFIKKSNAPNPYAYIEKKEDAEELAKFYAQREKAELKIHNSKGVIEKSLSFGREKLRG